MEDPRLDLFQEVPRVEGSMDGSAFGSSISTMPNGKARELAIYQQLTLGNIPDLLRRGLPITIEEGGNRVTFWTMPDFLSIGDNEDFLRMPMWPTTAQKAADMFNAQLPTRKMVNAIRDAVHSVGFAGFSHRPMQAVPTFRECNTRIQKELGELLAENGLDGPMKTVVVAKGRPKKNVAIYGGRWPNGNIVQGPAIQMSAHSIDYLDYSHGIRWVYWMCLVNEELMYIDDVLTHATFHALLSDEGVYAQADVRYAV